MRRTSNLPTDFARLPPEFAPDAPVEGGPLGPDPAFLRGSRPHRSRSSSTIRLLLTGLLALGLALVTLHVVRPDAVRVSRFALEDIRIDGARPLRHAPLRARLDSYRGSSLLELDLDRLRQDLGQLPWLESVSLSKQLPSTLVVRVIERPPIALVVIDDRLHHLSADGQLLGALVPGEGATDLPVVVQPGARYDDLARLGQFLARIQADHPEASRRISEIRLATDGPDSFVVFDQLAACQVVVPSTGFAIAWDRWQNVWPEAGRRFGRIGRADLRFRNRIVLTPLRPLDTGATASEGQGT